MTDDVDQAATAAGAVHRGRTLLELGRGKDAEPFFRRALAQDPGSSDLQIYLAHALHQQQRFVEAGEAAKAGLAANPQHLGGMLLLSAALAGQKDFHGAMRPIRRGLQIAPDFADLHRQEGAILIAQERSGEALASLERARALDPEDSDIVALHAAALYNVRRYDEAQTAVAEALRLNPNNSEGHRIRGLLSLRRGGGRDAVAAHQQALRLDPSDAEYRDGLALSMKTRNPLYGWLLRFSEWQRGLPGGARWALLFAPYLATRILGPLNDHLWARVALILVVAVVVLTWTLEPIMNTVLLCSRFARNLLPRDAKYATYAFLAYVTGALVCVAVNLATHSERALTLALGMAVWSVSAGQTHTVGLRRRTLALVFQGIGALLTVAAVATALAGVGAAAPLSGILVVTGVAMLWFTSLA
ncbi:tetratricopeptide repeat protein [Pedococcus soli]